MHGVRSCLLYRFIESKFKEGSSHTIGVEFGSKAVNFGRNKVKLQIWDTAGQERFRSVTRSYYRGAAGALLVYDISRPETFETISKWLEDARSLASPDIVIILVGHKSDLRDERQVSEAQASRYAQENDLLFMEASALTGNNADEVFLRCARMILSRIETGQIDPEKVNSGIQYGNASLRQPSDFSYRSSSFYCCS